MTNSNTKDVHNTFQPKTDHVDPIFRDVSWLQQDQDVETKTT